MVYYGRQGKKVENCISKISLTGNNRSSLSAQNAQRSDSHCCPTQMWLIVGVPFPNVRDWEINLTNGESRRHSPLDWENQQTVQMFKNGFVPKWMRHGGFFTWGLQIGSFAACWADFVPKMLHLFSQLPIIDHFVLPQREKIYTRFISILLFVLMSQAGAAMGLPSSALSTAIEPTMTPVALALTAQKGFRSFGVFSHGFLAGIAFWQLIMVRSKVHGRTKVKTRLREFAPPP